jgi:hypothetical protein
MFVVLVHSFPASFLQVDGRKKKFLRPLCGPFLKIIISRQCRAAQQPLCISQRPATCYIIMLLIIMMMIIAGSVIAATVSFLCNPTRPQTLDSPPPYVHIKMVIAFLDMKKERRPRAPTSESHQNNKLPPKEKE